MDFEKEMNEKDIVGGELTPIINTKRPQTKGLRSGNTQYFTNIDGKYVKDAEARAELADVEEYVYGALEQWQPLEDGYSNFWFELTNDTLSPWLNFSAKTNNATIDWGDGSGEVALDTLTPTHTYSKAGRYVVKVKGVTGIAAQIPNSYDGAYIQVLRHIELNNEITTISNYAFQYTSISEATIPSSVSTLGSAVFRCCGNLNTLIDNSSAGVVGLGSYCTVLRNLSFGGEIPSIGSNSFYQCIALDTVTIPSSVESIGNLAFAQCQILRTIHVQATTPPTLGTTPFNNIASDFIIYVPVGYAETYKAAEGWSAYSDHILEEGQTPNRAMLAKFNSAKTDEPQDDMR